MKTKTIVLESNLLTSLTLPADLIGLATLVVSGNRLASFNVPLSLTNLAVLDLGFNLLTRFSLPSGLSNATMLFLGGNLLANLNLPASLPDLLHGLDRAPVFTQILPCTIHPVTARRGGRRIHHSNVDCG